MGVPGKAPLQGLGIFVLGAILVAQVPELVPNRVRYDGADWSLKGEGVVCCPCSVPCPCRSNGPPSYGHCEATLYLRIARGNYGRERLDGMQVVDSGGMCAISDQKLSALYFEPSATRAQQLAFMKLLASFSTNHVVEFSHMRVVPFESEAVGGHFFKLIIPDTLEMTIDRNWGQSTPPMPMVAAQDFFSNALQYAQNIRYRMYDRETGLDFDYSRRQANYREVDLTVQQYRSKSMLIEFANGKGWFTREQIKLIKSQNLVMPQLDEIQKIALHLQKDRTP